MRRRKPGFDSFDDLWARGSVFAAPDREDDSLRTNCRAEPRRELFVVNVCYVTAVMGEHEQFGIKRNRAALKVGESDIVHVAGE
jgi:hypothetical protein